MQQQEDKIKYLGWGLVGASKGRMQIYDGSADIGGLSFDLEQQYGLCLPDPLKEKASNNKGTLYYLTYKPEEKVVAIAQYYSIREKGQSRPGPYFGSFIGVKEHIFSTSKSILCLLNELSIYQWDHYIDQQNVEYKEVLNGKKVELTKSMKESLKEVSEKLIKLTHNPFRYKERKTLFIIVKKDCIQDVLDKLLSLNIYYYYKDVYFSDNLDICTKMQDRKIDVVEQSAIGGLKYFNQIFYKEMECLMGDINNIYREKKQLENENSSLRNDMINQVQKAISNREEELKRWEIDLQNKTEKLQVEELIYQLGRSVFSEISSNANILRKANLQELHIKKVGGERNDFSQLIQGIQEIKDDVKNITSEPKTPFMVYLLSCISVLFFIFTLIMNIFSDSSKDIQKSLGNMEKKIEENIKNTRELLNSVNSNLNDLRNTYSQELEKSGTSVKQARKQNNRK